MSWSDLWSRPDQQAAHALQKGDADKAAKLFEDPQWRAAAYYRAKDYQQSIKALDGINTADALYNKGNALAKLGKLPEAISAYDEALKRDPQNKDARYNRDLLKKQLEKQSRNNSSSDQSRDQSQNQDKDKSQQSQESQSGSGQQHNQGQKQNGQSQQGPDQHQNQQQDQQQNQQQRNENASAADAKEQQSQQARDNDQQDNSRAMQEKNAAKDNEKESGSEQMKQVQQNNNDHSQDAQQVQTQATDDMKEHDEVEQANEQWLRRIPDDPGGLLRRKFQYQSQQNRGQQAQEEHPW